MRKVDYIWVFVLLASLALGCTSRLSGASKAYYHSLSPSQQSLLTDWKADVSGCKGYRDPENADQVLKLLKEAHLQESDVVALLGTADEAKHLPESHYLGYRFDGECGGGKLKAGAVFCVLQCYFDAETELWEMGSVVCG